MLIQWVKSPTEPANHRLHSIISQFKSRKPQATSGDGTCDTNARRFMTRATEQDLKRSLTSSTTGRAGREVPMAAHRTALKTTSADSANLPMDNLPNDIPSQTGESRELPDAVSPAVSQPHPSLPSASEMFPHTDHDCFRNRLHRHIPTNPVPAKAFGPPGAAMWRG